MRSRDGEPSCGPCTPFYAAAARAVLRVLERRVVSIPKPVRERMSATRDEQQQLRWLDRAVTAASVEDVLDDDG